MKNLIVISVLTLTACAAPSRYAVVKSNDVRAEIAVNGVKLVSLRADGSWAWHKTPEEVVATLYRVAAEAELLAAARQARVAKLEAEAAKPAPICPIGMSTNTLTFVVTPASSK